MEEKRYERRLIRYLRDGGFYAVHMDTSIDGWPDIWTILHGTQVFIEVKDAARGENVHALFERSQPPLYWKLIKHGARIIVALCDNEYCDIRSIYFENGSIEVSMWPLFKVKYPEVQQRLAEIL